MRRIFLVSLAATLLAVAAPAFLLADGDEDVLVDWVDWTTASNPAFSALVRPLELDLAATERPDAATGELLFGYHGVDVSDSPDRAAEYQSLDDSAHVGVSLAGPLGDDGSVSFGGLFWDSDEQRYKLSLTGGRVVDVEVEYDSFVHNLIHDPLTNLEAVNEVKVVQHTDLDPHEVYDVRYTDVRAGVEFTPPGAPGLYFGVDARLQQRDGMRQALTTDHCYSCHTYSTSREIDETTRDLSVFVGYQAKKWGLEYRFQDRQYDEDGDAPTWQYDDAFHPGQLKPVFEDRIWYDDDDGEQPFAVTPDSEKISHVLKGWVSDPMGGRFHGMIGTSTVENEDTGAEIDWTGAKLQYHFVFHEGKVDLTVGYRHDDYQNDKIFVDVPLRDAIAGPGPTIGSNYEEIWGEGGIYGRTGDRAFVADFTRYSALDRKVDEGRVSIRVKLPHRHTFRFDYEREEVDRDFFQVDDHGRTTTETNRFKATLFGRPTREWRYRVAAAYEDVTLPFSNVDGGCMMPAGDVFGTDGISPSPLAGPSLQYYETHLLRAADLSNQPTDVFTMRGNVTWSPGPRQAWTFTGRYSDRENDDTQATDWQHESTALGLNVWFAPAQRFYGTVSYTNLQDEFTSHVCVPVMDG